MAVTKTITAANSFSDPLDVQGGHENVRGGGFNVSVSGTFVATVTLQRSFDGGTTWLDVATYTSPAEAVGFEPEGCLYRIGVKTGDFVSGSINVRVGQ